MRQNTVEQQIDELFKLQQHLHRLLDKELYQEFQEQQKTLAIEVKRLFENNTTEALAAASKALRQFEQEFALLKNRAEQSFSELKEKSLAQRRNQNRLKAYK